MKRISKLQQLKNRFHIKDGKIDLYHYGVYRIGLLNEEIDDYLRVRANKMNIKRIRKQFDEIAGCNTMGCSPDGKGLLYRWDAERFADYLFDRKQTYFD